MKIASGLIALFCLFVWSGVIAGEASELCAITGETAQIRSQLASARAEAASNDSEIRAKIAALKAVNLDYRTRIEKLDVQNARLKSAYKLSLEKVAREKSSLEKFSKELDARFARLLLSPKVRSEIDKLEAGFAERYSKLEASKKFRAMLMKIEKLYELDSKGNGIFVEAKDCGENTVKVVQRSGADR